MSASIDSRDVRLYIRLVGAPCTWFGLAGVAFIATNDCAQQAGRGGSETTAVLGSVVADAVTRVGIFATVVLAFVGLILLWRTTAPKQALITVALSLLLVSVAATNAWVRRTAPCAFEHDDELCGTPIASSMPDLHVDEGGTTRLTTAHHVVTEGKGSSRDSTWTVASRHAAKTHLASMTGSQVLGEDYRSFIVAAISPAADRLVLLLDHGIVDFDLGTGKTRFLPFADRYIESGSHRRKPDEIVPIGSSSFIVPYWHSILMVTTEKDLRFTWLTPDHVKARLEETRRAASGEFYCFGERTEERHSSSAPGACVVARRDPPTLTVWERARAAFGLVGLLGFLGATLAMAGGMILTWRVWRQRPLSWERQLARIATFNLLLAAMASCCLFL